MRKTMRTQTVYHRDEKVGGSLCTGCGRLFSGVTAFDYHRTGDFKRVGSTRRCMTDQEMQKLGMVKSNGKWGRVYDVENAPRTRRGKRETALAGGAV